MVVRVRRDWGGFEVGLAASSLKRWFYRHLGRYHRKRWDEIDSALTSATRFRIMLFLSRNNPTTKHEIVDYMMETEQFTRRDSCVRVADRHLSEMEKAGEVEVLDEDKVFLKNPTPMIILKPPGIWISLGLGAGIIFFGLGYLRGDPYLMSAAAALTIYSAAVVAHLLLRGVPY